MVDEKEYLEWRKADVAAHARIENKLDAFDRDLLVSQVRGEEKDRSEKALRRQILTLAVVFFGTLSGLVAWAAREFHDLHSDVADNTAHFREFQAIGIEMKVALDETDNDIQTELRDLRALVQRHQINKQEHNIR